MESSSSKTVLLDTSENGNSKNYTIDDYGTMTNSVSSDKSGIFTSADSDNLRYNHSSFKSKLSPETLEIAIVELNERVEWLERDIAALKDFVLSTEGLISRLDAPFLLRFLRAKKFDYDRSYQLLLNYYRIRMIYPDIFRNLLPSRFSQVFQSGLIMVFPGTDKHGRKCIYLNSANWNPAEISITEVLRAIVLTLEFLIQDEETQIRGVVFLCNLIDFGWSQASHFTMRIIKLYVSVFQNAFPCRFKGLHFIFESAIFKYIFSMMKSFASEKISSRIKFHDHDRQSLFEYFDIENIPSKDNLNGNLVNFSFHTATNKLHTLYNMLPHVHYFLSEKDWCNKMLSMENDFLQYQRFGFQSDESVQRVSDLATYTDTSCLPSMSKMVSASIPSLFSTTADTVDLATTSVTNDDIRFVNGKANNSNNDIRQNEKNSDVITLTNDEFFETTKSRSALNDTIL